MRRFNPPDERRINIGNPGSYLGLAIAFYCFGDYWQDNIQLTGVPEPFSIILFALGGAALLRKRQR
jgi:hypothetical protein